MEGSLASVEGREASLTVPGNRKSSFEMCSSFELLSYPFLITLFTSYSFWKRWYWSFFRHVLLPERAASVACGGNHTVALTQSGESKTIFLVPWSELLWCLPSLQMSYIALHVPLLSTFRQIVHVWPLNQRAAWPGKPHPWVFHSPPCRPSFLT